MKEYDSVEIADAAGARVALGLSEHDEYFRPWTEALGLLEAPFEPLDIPEGDRLDVLLERLKIPREDHAELTAALGEICEPGTAWRWLLDRTVRDTVNWLDKLRDSERPVVPDGLMVHHLGAAGRWFHVVANLAAVSQVRAFHERHRIPEEVSWASLAILGEKVAIHRRSTGHGGLVHLKGVAEAFRGRRYRLGQLDHVWCRTGVVVELPHGTGSLTTVPDYAWAEGVDRFFNDRLGEYGSGVKLGYNAMDIRAIGFFLDPALEEHLPEDHELSRFANTLVRTYSRTLRASEPDERGLSDSDRSALEYAFGLLVSNVEQALALPTESAVQRAVTDHLRAGRHWGTASAAHPIFARSTREANTVNQP
ncbi:acyltransferase domain-containing protein [Streptomyces niveus]|uniref:acyltransferase domain-containing protein n=1 Tax=Streptomyces niveus TaxID=193462 RepID=UPI00343CEE59